MAAELNMYQAQTNEYKYEIGRLTKELNSTKAKYFTQKRKEHIQKQKNDEVSPQLQFEKYIHPKITGGGFSMDSSLTPSFLP